MLKINKKFKINFEKIKQAQLYLKEEGIDCWIIKTIEGSDLCMPLMFNVSIVGDAALIITKEKTIAVISIIDFQDVEESGLFDEIVKYSSEGFAFRLKEVIDKIQPIKIALNFSMNNYLADGLTVGAYRNLVKAIGDGYEDKIVSSEIFLQKLRSIKSSEEIAYIQKAIDITLEIYDCVFKKLKVGMTEVEVGQLFVEELAKRNVVNGITRKLTPPIIMTHNIAHRPPSDVKIKPGDYLIIDFSVDYNGYCSDIARTCYIAKDGEMEPSKDMQRAFRTIYEAINKAVSALKIGATGFDVDLAAREHILINGYPNIFHAVGHQVGREVHDGGVTLAPNKKQYKSSIFGKIEEGMVFAIEPTILIEEGPAIISEENVLVTKDGVKFLSKRQEELVFIK